MTWTDHLLEASRLGRDRCGQNLAGLMADHRVVGLVAYLDELERGFEAALVDKRMADRHGALAHAAGAVYALHLVRQALSRIMVGTKERGGVTETTEEQEA